MEVLKLIVQLAAAIVAVLVAKYVVPMIQSHTTQQQLEQLCEMVDVAVRAAEQVFGSGTGATKKEWVLNWLTNHGVSEESDLVDALVESAVYDMNSENGDTAE